MRRTDRRFAYYILVVYLREEESETKIKKKSNISILIPRIFFLDRRLVPLWAQGLDGNL